jgi:hypothetical protein
MLNEMSKTLHTMPRKPGRCWAAGKHAHSRTYWFRLGRVRRSRSAACLIASFSIWSGERDADDAVHLAAAAQATVDLTALEPNLQMVLNQALPSLAFYSMWMPTARLSARRRR